MKKVTSGGGCLCFTSRSLTIISGALSVLACLALLLVSVYLVINTALYDLVFSETTHWLRHQSRDKEVGGAVPEIWPSTLVIFQVTDIVVSYLSLLQTHHTPALMALIAGVVLHLLLSLLLLLGAMLHKPLLLVPWMVSDMIIITILFIIFSAWSFLSFFIGVLAAILFPFLGGLVLGVKIILWRQVMNLYTILPPARTNLAHYEAVENTESQQGGRRKMVMTSIAESEE